MFELARPWAFVLLLLPPIVWFFLPKARPFLPQALKFPFYDALSDVILPDPSKLRPVAAMVCIWFLMVVALSGPRWVGPPIPMEQEGRNIMMVLDLSESMSLQDMLSLGRPVSRLSVVKDAAQKFVEARAGDKIGLILFGTHAYLQTPLTFDRASVLDRIADATVGLAGNSTSLGDALGLAVKRLQHAPKKSRVVILLTDGANNSGVLLPSKAAELAKEEGITVYTIGLGAAAPAEGGMFNLRFGSDLDEESLKEIAKATGGRYFRATDHKSLNAIYQIIDALETVTHKAGTLRPQKDYFMWPLALALLGFLFWLARESSK